METINTHLPGQPGYEIVARAHPNIALIKYWGKRQLMKNLPAVSSLSITLDTLHTTTTLRLLHPNEPDRIELDGRPATPGQAQAMSAFLDLIRCASCGPRGALVPAAHVTTRNNFPTGAGLASSASGYAALALAAVRAYGMPADDGQLCALARQGSGSAARSVYGGFVALECGQRQDGSDTRVTQLETEHHWPLTVVIAIVSRSQKAVSSTEGMERTRLTSPYWRSWIDAQQGDMQRAQASIAARDFRALARVTNHSCMKMHALALAADPPLLYWQPPTLAAVHLLAAMHARGVAVATTIDAGPQVKAICLPEAAHEVAAALRGIPGVLEVLCVGLGPGVSLLDGVQ